MQFNMSKLKSEYYEAKGWREFWKWTFALSTFGLGALYLWATTSVIEEGHVGIRCTARGEMVLLPPGRHSNFPWESYLSAPRSLSEKDIHLGPYTIITVETGYVAKTYDSGKLVVLNEGQHLLEHAAHVFSGFIPTKQETKKLSEVSAYTNDNVGLTLHADVRYEIENPEIAIKKIDDIEGSIAQIGEMNISMVVGHHNLADFAPATASLRNDPRTGGMGEVIAELTKSITEQLRNLGIKLLSIGITSWSIDNETLAEQLAQGAVIQSQAASNMLSADREAKIKGIQAEADARAIETRARGYAEAIKIKGAAIATLGEQFKENPAALEMFVREQNTALVQNAQNPYLFFTPQGINTQLTLPSPTTHSAAVGEVNKPQEQRLM
jgi:regulator of protease activity HflC (stomatin/prohibitin superfamily)